MRKSREEAAQTRQRILETAAIEFRRTGISGTGLADLMGAAGLTSGGFYRHFDSKDDLVKESFAVAVNSVTAWIERFVKGRPGAAGILAAVEDYLSVSNRDSVACCPYVTLGSEVARGSVAVREAATSAFMKQIGVISAHLPGRSRAAAKKEALSLVFTMIGAMTVARMVSDRELSASILTQARKNIRQQLQEKRTKAKKSRRIAL